MAVCSELKLSAIERDQLATILDCEPDQLEEALSSYSEAALQEYVQMILGQKVFNRGSDILEYRLLLLTKTAFNGRLPDEQRVCALFQRSLTGSRSLIRAVLAKYQYELHDEIAASVKDTLDSVTWDDPDWSVIVKSENLIEAMNRALAASDGSLPQVTKKLGTVASWTLKPSSYLKLCERYGVAPKPQHK